METPRSNARRSRRYGVTLGAALFLAGGAPPPCARAQAAPQIVLQFGSPFSNAAPRPAWSWAARAPVFAVGTEPPAGIQIWDTRTWSLTRTLAGGHDRQTGGVVMPVVSTSGGNTLALSPDGRTLAVALDKTVQVWDTATGRLSRTLPAAAGALLWTANGRRVVTSRPGVTELWDAATGRLGARLPVGGVSVGLSPNGRTLAVAEQADTAGGFRPALWDIATGRRGKALRCDPSGITDGPMAFSPDGRTLAATGEDAHWKPPSVPLLGEDSHALTVKVWDTRTGRLRRVLPSRDTPSLAGSDQLEFSADGRSLVSSGAPPLRAWDTAAWRRRRVFGSTEDTGGALAPDGVTLLTVAGGVLRTTDTRTGARRSFRRPLSPDTVERLAWSPSGDRLAAQGEAALWVWDAASGRALWTHPDDSFAASCFTPDGAALVVADAPQVRRFAAATGKAPPAGGVPGLGTEVDVLPAPDGRTAAVNTLGKDAVRIVDVRTGRTLQTLPGFTEHSSDAEWSPDGQALAAAVASRDSGTFLIRVRGLRPLVPARTLTIRADCGSFAWAPDGKTLAVLAVVLNGGGHTRVELWDVGTGALRAALPVPDTTLYANAQLSSGGAVAVSPDGRRLAAVSGQSVVVYDLTTGRALPPVTLPGFGPNALAFSPDGARLAGGGVGGVSLWRVADGRLLVSLIGLTNSDPSVGADKPTQGWLALTPAGCYVASPGGEAAVRWRVGGALYPASRFAARFRRPGLVRRALLKP